MKVFAEPTIIPDVLVVSHEIFQDRRGFFMEVFRHDEYMKNGIPTGFVQLNHSGSAQNVLRGLHFQWDPPMGKLMRVTRGRAFLVAVDIRKGSKTLGKWVGFELSADERREIWAPAGFAGGFCVLSDYAEIQYLCTATHNPKGESGILWKDPD